MQNFIKRFRLIIDTIDMDYNNEKELNEPIEFVEDTLTYLHEQLAILERDNAKLSSEQKSNELPQLSNSILIDFAMYLTGNDKETVEQMYNDWRKCN